MSEAYWNLSEDLQRPYNENFGQVSMEKVFERAEKNWKEINYILKERGL